MLKVTNCKSCGHEIKVKLLSGYVHVQCENCKKRFVLTQNSLRYYIFIPLISVAVTVLISMNFIPTELLFIKLIFIIVASYLLNFFIGKTFIQQGVLQYEEKEE